MARALSAKASMRLLMRSSCRRSSGSTSGAYFVFRTRTRLHRDRGGHDGDRRRERGRFRLRPQTHRPLGGLPRSPTVGVGVMALGYAVVAFTSSLIAAVVLLACVRIAAGFVFPVTMATLQARAGTARGTVSSPANVAMYSGTTLGAAIAGRSSRTRRASPESRASPSPRISPLSPASPGRRLPTEAIHSRRISRMEA